MFSLIFQSDFFLCKILGVLWPLNLLGNFFNNHMKSILLIIVLNLCLWILIVLNLCCECFLRLSFAFEFWWFWVLTNRSLSSLTQECFIERHYILFVFFHGKSRRIWENCPTFETRCIWFYPSSLDNVSVLLFYSVERSWGHN